MGRRTVNQGFKRKVTSDLCLCLRRFGGTVEYDTTHSTDGVSSFQSVLIVGFLHDIRSVVRRKSGYTDKEKLLLILLSIANNSIISYNRIRNSYV